MVTLWSLSERKRNNVPAVYQDLLIYYRIVIGVKTNMAEQFINGPSPQQGAFDELSDKCATHDIASNTNLNNITTPGNYGCALNATAATLTNCPTTKAFVMQVMAFGSTSASIEQFIISSITNYAIYWRRGGHDGTSYTWTAWYKVTGTAV